jgi:hypothetical protein
MLKGLFDFFVKDSFFVKDRKGLFVKDCKDFL